jgi:hypothetical protein
MIADDVTGDDNLTWEQIAVIVEALEARKQLCVFTINAVHATEEERAIARTRLIIINELLERS